MTGYARGRHLKIRRAGLFAEQARVRALSAVIADDIIFILERQEFDDDEEELLFLNQHGINVLAGRVRSNIELLRKTLTLILRQLPREEA
jgi:hypothetical protein